MPAAAAAATVRVEAVPVVDGEDGPVEAEPEFEAGSLVPPELLSGPGWRVESNVPVRGYQARFTLRSRWGDLQADSVALLALRVSEMPAVERLHGEDVTRVLAGATVDRAGAPVRDAAAIASDPVGTATGLPRGIGRWFSDRWQTLRERVHRLGDRGHELVMDNDDAWEGADGPLGAATDDRPGRPRGWWQRRRGDVVREAKRESAFPEARRQLAARLGVDPDSRNPLLSEKLDQLAWAEAGGRFAGGRALDALGADVLAVAGHAGDVNRYVLQPPPAAVRTETLAALEPHCADRRLARTFVHDPAWTPRLMRDFTALFLRLGAGTGCEALLETALLAGDEAQARFVVDSLRLLDHHLAPDARHGRFVPQGALLAYETRAGELLLPLAVDWLAWTAELRDWFALPAIDRRPHRVLLVSGGISPLAARELTARGWSLVAGIPYEGAPPYLRPLDPRGPRREAPAEQGPRALPPEPDQPPIDSVSTTRPSPRSPKLYLPLSPVS